MKKYDKVRASNKDGLSQLFGTYWSDDSTSSDPPGYYEIDVVGIGKVKLAAIQWNLDRVLPTGPGSIVEHDGSLYVYMKTGWYMAKAPTVEVKESDIIRDHVLVFDADQYILQTGLTP